MECKYAFTLTTEDLYWWFKCLSNPEHQKRSTSCYQHPKSHSKRLCHVEFIDQLLSTKCKVAFTPNAFSHHFNFLNLVFFLLTLCIPLQPWNQHHSIRLTRLYDTSHQEPKNHKLENSPLPAETDRRQMPDGRYWNQYPCLVSSWPHHR